MKRNFVFTRVSILTLSFALLILSYPVHPPILANFENQLASEDVNYPVHPPILADFENQLASEDVNYPVHPPILANSYLQLV